MKPMVNQPDQDTQGIQSPTRTLASPEPPDAGQYRQRYSSPRSGRFIYQRTSAASHGLFTQIVRRWQTDPAFTLLSVAIALVVIGSFVLVSLGVRVLAGDAGGPTWSSAMTQHPVIPTPVGTIDDKPGFPTPITKKGSSTSSQPGAGPAGGYQPNTSNPNDQGTLTVQVTNIPTIVNNGSRVQVGIQTSEPNVDIRLQVTYDASPFSYISGANTTDGNGNGILNWSVRVRANLNGNNVQAMVVVVATDQSGQQATSQPTTVEIV